MKMKCPYCRVEMQPLKRPFGREKVDCEGWQCSKCGEELMTMEQLKELGDKYRKIIDAKQSTFSQWGNSIGIRIPSELVAALKIKPGRTARVTREKNGIKIVPA